LLGEEDNKTSQEGANESNKDEESHIKSVEKHRDETAAEKNIEERIKEGDN
jgi:hypothetical protein